MIVSLNSRGKGFLIATILLVILSIPIRVPTLILIAAFMAAYLVTYPLIMRRIDHPEINISGDLRHGILFRGEVDILQIKIENLSHDAIPLVHASINLPNSIFFVERPNEYKFTLEPKEVKTFNLPILPAIRGFYAIGPIKLNLSDPFQIFEDTIDQVEEIPVRIYPKRLGFKVSKTRSKFVFSKMVGFFAISMRGMGTDFHGLREYIRGDPSKIIAWKATARANKLISKEFEDERKLEILIGLDAGTTMRGPKFDFMLGMTMDIYEGFIEENKPVGLAIFDKKIISEYLPSPSPRRRAKIWADIYGILPRDVYTDYGVFDQWIDRNGITNTLIIILGDLEGDPQGDFDSLGDAVRNIRLRGNQVIFIDVFGYPFTYKDQIEDSAIDMGSDIYGTILSDVIGESIKQSNIFRALEMKTDFARHDTIYGYIKGPEDNIINALDRAMYSYFGSEWRSAS